MSKIFRIGTRDSELAVWQATQVQNLLQKNGAKSELIFIKSEGDKDLITPLYALGVQGIFTKTLDAALLNNRIDIAVHSMKDVPVQLAEGIQQAAVLKRGNWKDVFVSNPDILNSKSHVTKFSHSIEHETGGKKTGNEKTESWSFPLIEHYDKTEEFKDIIVATSSVRRSAQWLNHFQNMKINFQIENLRGNVNTRLRKLKESNWYGAIFAAAGLERINLLPENAKEIDWMLPAPAQGAIMVVCRQNDEYALENCQPFNDEATALCTKVERDVLKELMGGCSMPIGAFAEIKRTNIFLNANILTPDGKEKIETSFSASIEMAAELGKKAAEDILKKGGQAILDKIRNAKA